MTVPGSSARPTAHQLRAWLVETLRQLAPDFSGEITDTTSLGEEGVSLDSLTLADFIESIEAQWGLRVSEDDVSLETFGTLGRLVDFLVRRLPEEKTAR